MQSFQKTGGLPAAEIPTTNTVSSVGTICGDGRNCSTTTTYEETCLIYIQNSDSPYRCAPPCQMRGCKFEYVYNTKCSKYTCFKVPPSDSKLVPIIVSAIITAFITVSTSGAIYLGVKKYRAMRSHAFNDTERAEILPNAPPVAEGDFFRVSGP